MVYFWGARLPVVQIDSFPDAPHKGIPKEVLVAQIPTIPLNRELQLKAISSELADYGVCISSFTHDGGGDGGICKGACIDWIRRAVLAKKIVYDYDGRPEKAAKRLEVMAATHKAVNQSLGTVESMVVAAKQSRDEYNSKISWKQSMVGPLMFWIDDVEKLKEDKSKAMSQVLKVNKEIEKVGHTEYVWPEVVIHWNQMVKSKKTTDGVKARNLSDLKVWGIPSVKFDDIDDCLLKIFSLPNFVPGSCIMISAEFVDGAGHAFAVHKIGEGNFAMFDPNFGSYTFPSQEKLMQCFQFLLKTAYPSLGYKTEKLGVVVFNA